MSVQHKDIIVIGGSAGSAAALKAVLGSLPEDMPASLFVSTHVPATSPGFLVDVLGSHSALPIARAIDLQPIERGRVYVAPPDRHLLLIDSMIRLGTGPRENMSRPAIDPLFRSAALSFGPRVVGVVLSGMLDDGASGLHAIKTRGGTAVVQHPLDAQAHEMPLAALQAVEADHVARADQIGEILVALAAMPSGPAPAASDALRLEVEIAAGARLGSDHLLELGEPVTLTCPDCHGVLSEIRDARPLRFRCQIGHGYTAETLAARSEELDDAIRLAMRIMEERVTLVERMARDARAGGRPAVAELYDSRAAEYRSYAATLRAAATATIRGHETEAGEL